MRWSSTLLHRVTDCRPARAWRLFTVRSSRSSSSLAAQLLLILLLPNRRLLTRLLALPVIMGCRLLLLLPLPFPHSLLLHLLLHAL